MDGRRARPAASPPCSVAQSAPHQILVRKACKHKGDACKRGFRLLTKLPAAISAAGPGETFEVSGTAWLAGCVPDHGAPCVIGYRATGKATWLFGDIGPDQPLDELVAFARTFPALADGWLNGRDLPPRLLCDTTLARIPAAMIVTCEGPIQ